jgi:Ran GTPase-activating protein (RanGAP) involved in mRNA processing and transport
MVTPIRCPVITHPELGLADPAEFDAILARLDDSTPAAAPETFARGTLQPDGRLDLCKQGVGPLLAARLARAAAGSGFVRHLLLGTNGLGDDGARAVAAALAPGHRIETVYLGCNRIGAGGVAALAEQLNEDTVVRSLWLKRNPVGDAGVARLCPALQANETLRTLDLVNTGVTEAGLSQLTDALARRTLPLQRLFLGGNGFGPSVVAVLARLIREAGVRELYLSANHLGDEGSSDLARAAAGVAVMLGLGGNGITPAGVAALADHLSAWDSLDLARPPSQRALGAQSNHVGDRGAAALAAVLPASSLRRLDLRHTGVTGRGAKLLLQAIQDHPTLQYLGLNGGVPRRARRAAAEALRGKDSRPHPDIRAIASIYR